MSCSPQSTCITVVHENLLTVLLHVCVLYFLAPCDINFCPFHAHCIVKEEKAYCECVENCSTDEQFVCGTDDATYRNLCHLKKASCEERRRINQAYPGKCLKSSKCHTHHPSDFCFFSGCSVE